MSSVFLVSLNSSYFSRKNYIQLAFRASIYIYEFSQKSIFKNTGVISYKEHLLSQMWSALKFKLLPRNIVPQLFYCSFGENSLGQSAKEICDHHREGGLRWAVRPLPIGWSALLPGCIDGELTGILNGALTSEVGVLHVSAGDCELGIETCSVCSHLTRTKHLLCIGLR